MTSVFLVDDHGMFRAGVRSELAGRLDVVGEAGRPAEAVSGIRATRPDVLDTLTIATGWPFLAAVARIIGSSASVSRIGASKLIFMCRSTLSHPVSANEPAQRAPALLTSR